MNFEYCVAEGEAQVRSLIIGYWDDSRNMSPRNYEGECELVSTGLVPMSQYVVGIVAFDDMNREKVFVTDLMTGDPVGPKPTIDITETAASADAEWKAKAFCVKTKHAVEVRAGYFPKSRVDELIAGGSDMGAIISNNANAIDESLLAAAISWIENGSKPSMQSNSRAAAGSIRTLRATSEMSAPVTRRKGGSIQFRDL